MFTRKLLKNKVYAVLITIVGLVSIAVDNDITFCVFALIFAMPLFFAKENWMH